MVAALKLPPHRMTVVEFLAWDPGDGSGENWQLRDGEPEMMSPASDVHGRLQAQMAHLLLAHFERQGSAYCAVVAPGVVPRVRSEQNMLVPDIAVTCEPPSGHAIPNPCVLIEILSPSNEAQTRANVWAYTTITSVAEIVILHSARMAGEVWRREADGSWPDGPALIDGDGELRLACLGFVAPLSAIYRTTGLG